MTQRPLVERADGVHTARKSNVQVKLTYAQSAARRARARRRGRRHGWAHKVIRYEQYRR
jgi:hypothetical protein